MWKKSFFQQTMLGQLNILMQKKEVDLYHMPDRKINAK